ncbi:MAG: MATE family efflux transporter [Eubacteriales bacterium]|nr:MATE family efflux transporter [Eubacteriales bacterium]
MKASGSRYQIDMINGPLFGKILMFAFPLMLSSMLQLLFNAADVIVVGRFAGETSLAAVGSTGSLTNMLVNLFIGFSVGTNVLTAQAIGAKDDNTAKETVHTSVLFSVICGIALAVTGFFLARPLLAMMDTPADVIDKSTIYMQIYFLGMPVSMLYNFGYAVMRALGDTRRPMYYLILAGIVNVVLNIIFVTQFHMDVAGVALATIISQAISAVLIVRALCKLDNSCRLNLKELKIKRRVMVRMVRIGLPAGIQSTLFATSNVLIQSSINFFGKTVMAGNAAAANIEGFVYVAMNAFQQTAMSFTSQNYGAKRFDRIKRVFILCVATVFVVGLATGWLAIIFGDKLIPLYSTGEEVIEYGLKRLVFLCGTYFFCGIMDTIVGAIRGFGRTVIPMIVSLFWACAFRIIWVLTVFEQHKELEVLYISYPISWICTIIFQVSYFIWLYNQLKNSVKTENL